MSTINLSVDLTCLNSEQVYALSNFVNAFGGYAPSTDIPKTVSLEVSPQTEPEKKKRASKNSTAQAGAFAGEERSESVVDNYEAAKDVPVVDAKDADDDIMAETSDVKISMDDLRSAAADKMPEHKDALKAKLLELGGPAVTALAKLQPEHYGAFLAYTKTL